MENEFDELRRRRGLGSGSKGEKKIELESRPSIGRWEEDKQEWAPSAAAPSPTCPMPLGFVHFFNLKN